MLGDISKVEGIYLACGYTDLRQGIDGLTHLVQGQFQLDPCSNKLFLFCGRRRDRIKALLWEGDGFVLLYKRMENGGGFQWPRSVQELRQLNWQQLRWLLEGLSVDQPKANKSGDISIHMPDWDVHEKPENMEYLLPWGEYIQERFE